MIQIKCKSNTGRNKIKSIDNDVYFTPVVDGKEYSHVGETSDVAMLIGLGIKYDGLNSQFAKNACRMLKIDSNWTE